MAVPKLKKIPQPAEWIVKGHLPQEVIPNATPILSVQVTAINPAISPSVIPKRVSQGQKHIAIKAQHPELDIRFVFQRNNTLTTKAKMTYGAWAEMHGFKWCIFPHIPPDWFL